MSKNEFDALLLKKLQEEAFEYKPESWRQLAERLHIAMPVQEEAPSFDALLAAKLQEDIFEYNPASWNQLATKLDDAAPGSRPVPAPFPLRKWGIALGTAAALLITVGLAVTWNHSDNNTGASNPVVVNNNTTQPSLPATEQQAAQRNNPVAAHAAAGTPLQQVAQQPSSALPLNNKYAIQPVTGSAPNNPATPQNLQLPPVMLPQEHKIVPVQPEADVPVIATAPRVNYAGPVDKAMTAPVVAQETATDYITPLADLASRSPDRYTGAATSRPKTNIAFGGGVNYGNINAGYTAGVSVKRKIGSDFFVDGTVAMMYNNNATNVAANNGPSVVPPAGTASKPAKGSVNSFSAPALDPIQKLYYVQMNPSFGYQVEDKVALSVGGDFQRMLNKKDEIVQPDNNNTRIFPTMDIGLTTKSEFTITPNLQAGLMYREGLNNLFKADAPYVNRRYVQVQFKYNIPLK